MFKENVHLFSHRQRAELEHTTHIVVGVLGGSLNPNLSLLDTGHLRLSLSSFFMASASFFVSFVSAKSAVHIMSRICEVICSKCFGFHRTVLPYSTPTY